MFDIGWQELFIIAVLAIIVVGPKDLPKALKTVTIWVRKARSMAREFQSGVDEMVRESELDEFKKQAKEMGEVSELRHEIENSLSPDSDVADALDMSDVEKSFETVQPKQVADNTEDKAADKSADKAAGDKS